MLLPPPPRPSHLGLAVAEQRLLQLLPPPHHDPAVPVLLLLLPLPLLLYLGLAVAAELMLQRLPASSSTQITHSLHVLLLPQNLLMMHLRTTMLLSVGLSGRSLPPPTLLVLLLDLVYAAASQP
jgi:hypothetical protein